MSKRRKNNDLDLDINTNINIQEVDSKLPKRKKIVDEFINIEINTLDDLIELANIAY